MAEVVDTYQKSISEYGDQEEKEKGRAGEEEQPPGNGGRRARGTGL